MLGYVVVFCLAAHTQASPSGAPTSACYSMKPRHKVPAQKSDPPFTITVSTRTVKPSVPMEVVLSGEGHLDFIGGFLLQARHEDKPFGTFEIGTNNRLAQLMDCGAPANTLTHKLHEWQYNKLAAAFTWTPPLNITKDTTFRFRATIAKSFSVFWVGVESAPIEVMPD